MLLGETARYNTTGPSWESFKGNVHKLCLGSKGLRSVFLPRVLLSHTLVLENNGM